MKKIFIITGPSGVGKTTLLNLILDKIPQLNKVKTSTTREKRGEEDDYYFLSLEDFKNKIENEEFLEWEEVYENKFYGTLKSEIDNQKNNILIMDVNGAQKMKELFGDKCHTIFIKPKSPDFLKIQLERRGEKDLDKRLEKSELELSRSNLFDFVIINDNIFNSYKELSNYIDSNLYRNKYNQETLVVNLFAPPGTGKSTLSAALFSELKFLGVNCELVTEYVKGKVWEGHLSILENQVYLLGKQHHRIFSLIGKVDVVITDSPILMQNIYNTDLMLSKVVENEFDKFNNLNFLLRRKKKYNPKGRTQTLEESDQLGTKLKSLLDSKKNMNYIEVDGSKEGLLEILKIVIEKIRLETHYDLTC